MANTKIDKYGFGAEVLSLAAQPGMTTYDIATILTEKLNGLDSISQPTVSRWLAVVRKDRSEQTREVVHNYIKGALPKDLEVLEEVEAFFLNIFRNTQSDPATGNQVPIVDDKGERVTYDIKTRSDAGLKVVDIVFKKLKAGGLEDPPPDDDRPKKIALTDEDGGCVFDAFRSGIQGIVRRLREVGVTGPEPKQEIENPS